MAHCTELIHAYYIYADFTLMLNMYQSSIPLNSLCIIFICDNANMLWLCKKAAA